MRREGRRRQTCGQTEVAWPPPCPRPGRGPSAVLRRKGGWWSGWGGCTTRTRTLDTKPRLSTEQRSSVDRAIPCSLSTDQAPGSPRPESPRTSGLQSDALSTVHPASRRPRAWTRLSSREAATETRTHTGRTSRGDRGGGALSTARSRRSAALTPRWRFDPTTVRKDTLCSRPRSCSPVTATAGHKHTACAGHSLQKKTEFIFKGGARPQVH